MKKKSLAILLAMMLVLSALTACGTSEQTSGEADGTKAGVPQEVVYASTADAVGLSPILTNDSASSNINVQIYETLFEHDAKTFEIKPLLAESYETPDESTWVIKLKQGIKFHDGTDFNAAAVKFTFDRILDPKVAAPRASILEAVESIETPDEYTVVLKTKYPNGIMLAALAHSNTAIVSPAAVEKYGDLMSNPVGTGPYKFEERVPGDHTTLVKNTDYWQGEPTLDKITFKVVPEVSTAISMLETGEVDFIDRIPAEHLARINNSPDLETIVKPGTSTYYFGFNHKVKPLDDLKVRQAMAYAIDEKAFVGTLEGLGVQSDGVIGPMLFGYDKSIEGKGYEHNVEKAKELLAEAGYPNGFDITLTTPNRSEYMKMSEILQAQLKEVGVNVDLNVMEWGAYLASIKKTEQELFVSGWSNVTGDGSELVYPNLHPDNIGSRNNSNYANQEIADLITKSRTTVDQDERKVILQEVNEKLVQDVAWVPMYHGVASIAHRKNVKGLDILANGQFFLNGVTVE